MSVEPPPTENPNDYGTGLDFNEGFYEDDTTGGITPSTISQYAITYPVPQNTLITYPNSITVLNIEGNTTTQTANDNSTKLASTSYADNAGSQSAFSLLSANNTFTGLNKFTNTNGIVFNKTRTELDTDASLFNWNQIGGGTAFCDNAIRTGGVNIFTKGDGLNNNTLKLGRTGITIQANATTFTSGHTIPAGSNNTTVSTTAFVQGVKNAVLNEAQTFSGDSTFSGDNSFTGDNTFSTLSDNSFLSNLNYFNGTATTQTAGDNTTKLSTTAYADTSSTNAKNALLATLTATDITYSGDNTYSGTSTFSGTTTISATANLTGAVNATSSTDNITLGNTSGGTININSNSSTIGDILNAGGNVNIAGGTHTNGGAPTPNYMVLGSPSLDATYIRAKDLKLNDTGTGTTSIGNTTGILNITGAVNASSPYNFIAGNASGGEVQLNSKKTYIGTGGLGNTDNVSIASGGNSAGSFAVLGSDTLETLYLRGETTKINDGGGTTIIAGTTSFTGSNVSFVQNPILTQRNFPAGTSLGGLYFTNYSANATALNTEKTYAVSGVVVPGRYLTTASIRTYNTTGANTFVYMSIRSARTQQSNNGTSPPFSVGGVQQYIGGQGNELYEQIDYANPATGIARQIIGFIDIDSTYKYPYLAINNSQPGGVVYFQLSLFRMS